MLLQARGETQYQHTDIVENFEVNQRTTETIVTPGAIKRLSVAVVVNKNLEEDLKDSIVETVSAALGLDSSRQDQISVTGVFFDTTLADAIGNVLAPEEAFPRTYIYAAVAGVVVVLGIAIFLMVRRRKRKDEEVELPIPDIFVEDIPAIPPEALARQRSRENVERLAKTNPEVVATLIKSWLLEDER
jgi:flagellar M-ring protein FliF